MNIIINQKRANQIIKNAERVISRSHTLPILQSVLIKTENGRLKISATNLEIGVTYWISAKIEQEGMIAVPAKILSEFIGSIDDEKIILRGKENVLEIVSENYKTQILCPGANEFPIIPETKEKNSMKISAKSLREALLSVVDSVALSETRPELSGVYVNFETRRIIFAATDSYRLSEKIIPINDGVMREIIIPRPTVLELIRICDIFNDDLHISFSENQVFVKNGEFSMVSRLIDGRYPDYKKVIPENFISLARIKKTELEKGIKTASIFSSNASDIKIKVKDKKVEIWAKNSTRGEISATLDGELKNDPFEINVNYNYLLDGLKSVSTENALIQFTGEGSPLVLTAEDKKDFTYLIMPLRN